MLKRVGLILFSAGLLVAQVGQPPPGQMPPYPPGTPGMPMPHGNDGPNIPRRGKKGDKGDQAPTQTLSGVVRSVAEKSFDIEVEDTRIVTIQFTDTVKLEDVKPGEGLDVQAAEDKDGNLRAVKIQPNAEIRKKIEPNHRAAGDDDTPPTPPPSTVVVKPGDTHDADDEGPPTLKRGKPAQHASAKREEEPDIVASSPSAERTFSATPSAIPAAPPVNPRQALVEKARAAAAVYTEGLPDYICQEVVTRYESETRQPNWHPLDVVSAELIYEKQKERYRNLQINGKPSKKKPEETGSWSTGEFGTILRNLFDPGTDADFEYHEEDTIAHRQAAVYNFEVIRERSNWKIWVPGQQYILPAYKGSIWIDKQTANVLRIEMQAVDIPEAFPLVSVETSLDYDYVSLGTPEKFLLPIRADALDCARDSNVCSRNRIEFRNYHKFAGESTIKFNE